MSAPIADPSRPSPASAGSLPAAPTRADGAPAGASPPGLSRLLADVGPAYAANGLLGLIFSISGPLAIILSVGTRGGLSQAELASWVFGVLFVNGFVTIAMSWRYRMPMGFAWTIPGTVLVGPALQHASFAEVVGAFWATSALVLALGASGLAGRLMRALPMPIVMAMVAGVFLRFGLDLVRALHQDLAVAAPMVAAFVALTARPAWGRRMPPLIGALLAGALAVALLGRIDPSVLTGVALAQPVFTAPAWSASVLVELVVPLAITVLVIQNGQGVAVLRSAGHAPPVDAVAVVSGLGAAASAAVGAVSTCLTGPTNALLTSSGEPARQYTAALVFGAVAMAFGLLAPTFTGLMLATPPAFIMALGGLAMLRVLQAAFATSVGAGRFAMGSLVCLLVTVADQPLLNVGAAFWGLLAGCAVSWLIERGDYRAMAAG